MTASTTPDRTSSLLERLRGLFGGGPTDGRLGAKVDATRAVALVNDGGRL